MPIPHILAWMFQVGVMVLGAGALCGQDYPNKPVRVVTAEVGGGTDFTARLIAQGLTNNLGQQVIVDNRVSAVMAEIVSNAPPNGYTLLLSGQALWLGPLLRKTSYDPVADFSPITLVSRAPHILVVHPSLPVRSVKELIALAKARPGVLNYASGGTGSSNHLAAELFKAMAGVNMVRINYKSTGPAFIDLIAGRLQVMFPTATSAAPHIKSGKLRALAVASLEPSELLPELPTVAASGLPEYESGTIVAIFAPAKSPAPVIDRLNREIVRFLNRTDAKEKFFNAGVEIVGSSPQQLAAAMKSEMARMSKVIKDAGIRAE